MKKIILFDLDGTLIDSKDSIVSTIKYAFTKEGCDFKGSNKDIENLIGYPLDIMFQKLGASKNNIENLVEKYKNRYKDISIDETILLYRAYDAVVNASKFARLGVVTTKTKKYSLPILENLRILKFFEVITGIENVKNPKPHPEPILLTLEQMNYNKNKDEAWMIGDTILDLICANNAKIKNVGVLSGFSKKEELEKYTDVVKANSFEAVNYLRNL